MGKAGELELLSSQLIAGDKSFSARLK